MKEIKSAYRFVASLGMMAIVIAGSFLGSAMAMNVFTGITILAFIIFILSHISVEKTVEANPKVAEVSKKLWGGKLMIVQYTVIFVCLAGSAHWLLFFTWIIILFASLSLEARYKEALEELEKKKGATLF